MTVRKERESWFALWITCPDKENRIYEVDAGYMVSEE